MSTLVQIESAVAELPAQDQWSLLSWLQKRLSASSQGTQAVKDQPPEWLEEIRRMRAACSTGVAGTPVEQLITEIRS